MENYQENSKTPFTLRDFEHWLYVTTSEGYGDDYENVPEEFWNFDPTSDPPGPYQEPEVPPGPDYPFDDTVEREIGGTRFLIRTECGGAERLSEKIARLISSEREENCA